MKFFAESTDTVNAFAEHNKQLADSVVSAAKEVLRSVEGTFDSLDQIVDTSSTVSESLKDISHSATITAENIEHQTMMTNSIQNVIMDTYERTNRIVTVASESTQFITFSQNTPIF